MPEQNSFIGRKLRINQVFIDFKLKTVGQNNSPFYTAGEEYEIVSTSGSSGFQISNGLHTVYCPMRFVKDMLVKE